MSVDRSVLLLREFTERLRRTTGTERRIVKEETVFDKHDNNQFSCKSHLLFHFSAAGTSQISSVMRHFIAQL